ncbi:DNA-directed RNA polymerase sigma-70 factor [Parapedobacter pyrenivorans]|uniref:DNA-directed RNA polymerase sigma-70 factor n=1 Tax=Parapedobacter pyrenivorans TaxID=1305674 RepID=A0A917I0S9_9SPHI|nr:RNA polymerase sigma factor [Parapedobacter pyrenivorans]GGH02400.1 DNA-directed RNA polymerase sigma-70 factor [Parapedobacter pyrenivorans]
MEASFSDKHYELVVACKRGDRQSQFKLYNLYAKAMYNTALRIVQDEAEAADVLQEAFIDAFTRLDSFRQESTFGLWMKQIVVNKSISALRKRKLELQPLEAGDEVPNEEPEDNGVELQVAAVKHAIDKLPDGYRLVLTLYLLEGYDHEEIAHILRISEATSRSQFLRGRRKLLNYLAN